MKRKSKILISLGLVLVAAAVLLEGYNIFMSLRGKMKSDNALQKLREIPINTQREKYPQYILDPNMEMPVEEIDGLKIIGTLNIPSLELELPVQNDWSLEKLQDTPCRYYGSAYLDNMVICAHNYYYHFGKFRRLSTGDSIVFMDNLQNVFEYKVTEVLLLNPFSVNEVKTGNPGLTLFTCTPGGTQRITVRCEKCS